MVLKAPKPFSRKINKKFLDFVCNCFFVCRSRYARLRKISKTNQGCMNELTHSFQIIADGFNDFQMKRFQKTKDV